MLSVNSNPRRCPVVFSNLLPNVILDSILGLLDIPQILALGLTNRDLQARILRKPIDCSWVSTVNNRGGPSTCVTRLFSMYIKGKIAQSKSYPMTQDRAGEIAELEKKFKVKISYSGIHMKHIFFQTRPTMPLLKTLYVEHFSGESCFALAEGSPLLESLKAPSFENLNAGIEPLATLSNLVELETQNISDANLYALRALKLHTLKFPMSYYVTDIGLSALSSLPLRVLNLSWCERVTDIGIQFLISLQLESLDISKITNITDAGVRSLSVLTALQELHINECSTTNNIVETVSKFIFLKKLSISHITDDGLDVLSSLPLEDLSVSFGHDITDSGLMLNSFPVLEKLNLEWCKTITDEGINSLTHLTALKQLNLSCCYGITGKSLTALTGLKELDIHEQQVKLNIGRILRPLTNLEVLTLYDAKHINQEDVQPLAALPCLNTLHIFPKGRRCQLIDEDDLARLIQLTNLRTLQLTNYQIKEIDKKTLGEFFKVIES